MQTQTESTGLDRQVIIVVNAVSHQVDKDDLSFDDVVKLAQGLPTGENILYSVTYQRGRAEQSTGILDVGQTVKAKNGMIFNVTATDRS